ncbi:MAG: MerR family transcriptional regulator [Bacillota bacterium]|nr:MerR family transcriptional regulator [Bacillota bacterium]
MKKQYFQIEDVAKKLGLTKRALRYYEDIELVKPIRTEAGYRLYTEEDIEKVQRIKEFRDILGFSLNEVKEILNMEQSLREIFSNESSNNIKEIHNSIETIQQHIQLIDQKEMVLEKVKQKYEEVLKKLIDLENNK